MHTATHCPHPEHFSYSIYGFFGIIEKGRLVQKAFKDTLFNNMDDSMKEILFKGMEIMEDNLDRILEDQ